MTLDGETGAALANPNEKRKSKNAEGGDEDKEKVDYNPRWMGYLCIMMFSGINFIAISNVSAELPRTDLASSIPFGVLTFAIASLVLIQERCRAISWGFNYTKSKNGLVEGITLVFCVIWWVVGVAYITRPGGIAYTVSNIYYSAWLTVFSCVYTLNEWSESKDILSIAEITSVSFTLRYWWIHFTAAFVVFISSCSLVSKLIVILGWIQRNMTYHARHNVTIFSLSISAPLFIVGNAIG